MNCRHCGQAIEHHEILGWVHYNGVFNCVVSGHPIGFFATSPSSR